MQGVPEAEFIYKYSISGDEPKAGFEEYSRSLVFEKQSNKRLYQVRYTIRNGHKDILELWSRAIIIELIKYQQLLLAILLQVKNIAYQAWLKLKEQTLFSYRPLLLKWRKKSLTVK